MSGLKRFIVFVYDNCESNSGLKDAYCVTNNFEEALQAAESPEARKDSDTIDIYDIQKEKAICSFYLTTTGEWLRDE